VFFFFFFKKLNKILLYFFKSILQTYLIGFGSNSGGGGP